MAKLEAIWLRVSSCSGGCMVPFPPTITNVAMSCVCTPSLSRTCSSMLTITRRKASLLPSGRRENTPTVISALYLGTNYPTMSRRSVAVTLLCDMRPRNFSSESYILTSNSNGMPTFIMVILDSCSLMY